MTANSRRCRCHSSEGCALTVKNFVCQDREVQQSQATTVSSPPADVTLRPPQHPVNSRCVPWWTVLALGNMAVWWIIEAIALVVIAVNFEDYFTIGVIIAVVLLVIQLTYVVMMPRIRFRVHRWELTDEAVYTKSGWLSQAWQIAPLSRVQTVDSTQGPLQRMFRLRTVTVTTASAAGPVTISALDQQEADELVHTLTRRTQATLEDGT